MHREWNVVTVSDTVKTTYGTIQAGTETEAGERARAATQQRIEAQRAEEARKRALGLCPFRDGINNNCIEGRCAFWASSMCALGAVNANEENSPVTLCPVKHFTQCTKQCAAWNGERCTMVSYFMED